MFRSTNKKGSRALNLSFFLPQMDNRTGSEREIETEFLTVCRGLIFRPCYANSPFHVTMVHLVFRCVRETVRVIGEIYTNLLFILNISRNQNTV